MDDIRRIHRRKSRSTLKDGTPASSSGHGTVGIPQESCTSRGRSLACLERIYGF